METDGCWILEIFGTQVTNKKRQLCPSFPGKLSIFLAMIRQQQKPGLYVMLAKLKPHFMFKSLLD